MPLLPVTYLFRRCEDDDELREDLFSKRLGLSALPRPRRPLRLLLPDPGQDRRQAGRDRAAIFEERSEDVVRDISNAKQELIAYRKIIKPERATSGCSSARASASCPRSLEVYYDDIVDAAERIWDLLDNYKEVIEGLESTNEAFISHKQQYRLQLLTVVTVILLPLTLLASIFGMNVKVPGEANIDGVLAHPRSCSGSGRRSSPFPLAALAVTRS